jgi:hypothetical protein
MKKSWLKRSVEGYFRKHLSKKKKRIHGIEGYRETVANEAETGK